MAAIPGVIGLRAWLESQRWKYEVPEALIGWYQGRDENGNVYKLLINDREVLMEWGWESARKRGVFPVKRSSEEEPNTRWVLSDSVETKWENRMDVVRLSRTQFRLKWTEWRYEEKDHYSDMGRATWLDVEKILTAPAEW